MSTRLAAFTKHVVFHHRVVKEKRASGPVLLAVASNGLNRDSLPLEEISRMIAVYTAIIREIAAKGNASRFKKHERGVFVAGKGA